MTDEPRGPAAPGSKTPFAKTSLIMGIISMPLACVHGCGIVMALGAIVFGLIALKDIKKNPGLEGRKMAIVGICMGSFFFVFSIFAIIFFVEDFQHIVDWFNPK